MGSLRSCAWENHWRNVRQAEPNRSSSRPSSCLPRSAWPCSRRNERFLPQSSISKRKRLLNPPPKPRPRRLQPQPLRATFLATLPPADTSRLLKKSASGVLASLRGSTYRSVRLDSSFAAALLDGLFEQPAETFSHQSRCPRH